MAGDHVNVYPVKGYSITVCLDDARSREHAPWASLLDDRAKIVTSRLGADRFRVAGTAELNGFNRDIRADRIALLVEWTRRYFPEVSTARVIPWSGLRPMLPSMLPKVGQGRRPGVFYNTGHGHLGWTLSAATAELVAQAVLRKWPGKPVQSPLRRRQAWRAAKRCSERRVPRMKHDAGNVRYQPIAAPSLRGSCPPSKHPFG
ncbi:hypothetical protein GCM10010985_31560 [Caballeronia grimmiae]|uniref:FAD dependent oxidoreductase domain-containing protein n=1 Tax=Caballeronia grimmiae TaxID=1071679 RepID=A0ABQ1RRE9_9BURK|nr:hypothetical protein GCM10010985_31560 [Caballeronia grimmiae]